MFKSFLLPAFAYMYKYYIAMFPAACVEIVYNMVPAYPGLFLMPNGVK